MSKNFVFCSRLGIWTDSFMLLSFCDKSKICFIQFAKKLSSDFRKLEKLAALEPKVNSVDSGDL